MKSRDKLIFQGHVTESGNSQAIWQKVREDVSSCQSLKSQGILLDLWVKSNAMCSRFRGKRKDHR